MIDLERALVDLAEQLDHPIGLGLDNAVRRRILDLDAEPARPPRRARTLVAIAAVVVVIAGAVVAIAPARHAVADWLGIGAVEIRRSDHPLPVGSSAVTVPGAVTIPGQVDPAVAARLAAARRVVDFPIVVPRDRAAGALRGVQVDRRVRGGLVVLRYAHFTLVEIATDKTGPTIGKLLGQGATVDPVTVNRGPGMWIKGGHEIGYLDRSGNFETDTVRRAGPVLLWGRAGVTYRIEGLPRLTDALAIARTLG